MLQRDDFKTRLEKGLPIFLHELQYPIMQGWDSVVVRADVELGGTDQLFNIMVGRDLQKEQGQPQQVACLQPILEGLDGVQKMSKSLDNYIGISEAPKEMFGKMMSISDELMARYYQVLFSEELPAVHPMEAKKQLAFRIVEQFHDRSAAQSFARGFQSAVCEARSGFGRAAEGPRRRAWRRRHFGRRYSLFARVWHCEIPK